MNRFASSLLLILIGGLCAFQPVCATSTYIIMNGTVVDIANTINGMPGFAVMVAGASGPCANPTPGKQGAWIVFPENKSQSSATHRMAQQLAMLALVTGKKVRIANYEDTNCFGANFISLSNGESSSDIAQVPVN
jgi:hypothetical protein